MTGLGICSRLPPSTSPPLGVILTDVNDVVPLLRTNIALNEVLFSLAARESDCGQNHYKLYTSMQHCWGDSTSPLSDAVSSYAASAKTPNGGLLVVASDVVYDPVGYQPLVLSITSLLLHHYHLYVESQQCKSKIGNPPVMVLTHRHRNVENMK